MQDWDTLAVIILGIAVSFHSLYQGWQLWRQAARTAALGALILALITGTLPVILARFGR